ncbi:hypothetical protein D3C80_1816270 [compost metagenome]
MHPHVQGRQVKAATPAGDAQALTHQANQPVFTQRLAKTRSRHQCRPALFQLIAQLIHQRHVDTWHIGPGQKLLLLPFQLFQ